jgi:predicted regulator of Ras-like GTPase activity (Roadblock/LC7/MglB family)
MFQSILAGLKIRSGARWAMIVGNDGVLLEADNAAFRTEAESLAAEYASFFRASRKAASETDMGGLNGSLLLTEQGKLLLQTLTPDYFLVLSLQAEAHAGKALFEISRAADSLEEALIY